MQQLLLQERASIGSFMDIKAHGDFLYAIQRPSQFAGGRLCVLRSDLSLASEYVGIGNARQIEIVGNVAVVTAREDGLWIFDVSAPTPALLCHYQTVEYATGVALYGNLAFISCRQYGVQILDIQNPKTPRHLSLVRIGEIQSSTVADGILYGGAWGEMKVVAVDVHNPAAPQVLAEIPLQGRGDGVCVHHGILYAATGQHARGIQNTVDESDPFFGMGNGVEAFDVRDPAHPVRIGGARFEKAYCSSIDMWEAAVYGDKLIVNNAPLGVYVLDPQTLSVLQRFPLPPCDRENGVTGVTVQNGDLYMATMTGGLYVYRGTGIAHQVPNPASILINATPQPFSFTNAYGSASLAVCHSGDFPVLSLALTPSHLALACGEDGVHLLDKSTLQLTDIIPTTGMAQNVKYCNGRLFVAEEAAGVEIFSLTDSFPRRIGAFRVEETVYQLQPSRSGRYLLCGCACNKLKLLDVSDPMCITEKYTYRTKKGLLYGDNFASNTLADGTMLLFCHRDGLIFTNPDRGDDCFHVIEYVKRSGFCGYCSGDGIEADKDRIFYTQKGGYVLLSVEDTDKTSVEDLPFYAAEQKFRGLLTPCGDLLVATNRPGGQVSVLDISDPMAPRLLAKISTCASPGKAVFLQERILIPGGRSGLLELTL